MDVLEELAPIGEVISAIYANIDILARYLDPFYGNALIEIKFRTTIVVPTLFGKIHTGNRAVRNNGCELMAFNGIITYYKDRFITIQRRKSFYVAFHNNAGMVSNDDPDNVIIHISLEYNSCNYDRIDTIYGTIENSKRHIMDRITARDTNFYKILNKKPLVEYKVINNDVQARPRCVKIKKPKKIHYYSTNDIKEVFKRFNSIITNTFCGLIERPSLMYGAIIDE